MTEAHKNWRLSASVGHDFTGICHLAFVGHELVQNYSFWLQDVLDIVQDKSLVSAWLGHSPLEAVCGEDSSSWLLQSSSLWGEVSAPEDGMFWSVEGSQAVRRNGNLEAIKIGLEGAVARKKLREIEVHLSKFSS